MKKFKVTVFVKELSIRIRNERSFRVKSTILFCLLISFVVVILGMFVNDHVKCFLNSDEYYYYYYNNISSTSPYQSSYPYFSCNFSLSASILLPLNFSTRNETRDHWINPTKLWHSMNDDELMWRASMVPHYKEYPYNRTPKVAFMFLSRGRLPLVPLWEMFFNGYQGLYSIYLHASPEFTNEPPETSVFFERQIPSKPVEWGRSSMIDAERRLLANALLDFSNERFVLLSETCIPLFNFTTIYKYLIKSKQSFVGSFDDPRHIGRGRYNKRMWPTLSLSNWRKGNQWFEMHRSIAIEVVSDTTYYPVFRDFCRPPCYTDEHYIATLVTKVCSDMNSNRTVTWVDWSRGGSHPTRFVNKDLSESFLNRIRNGFNCSYNGRMTSVCFLFARKFHPNTLEILLNLAPRVLGFGS